jgi:hypothetical protein
LLRNANVANAGDRIPLQFYPAEIINLLGSLEAQQLARDNREVANVKSTIFNVVGSPGNYRFELGKVNYLN